LIIISFDLFNIMITCELALALSEAAVRNLRLSRSINIIKHQAVDSPFLQDFASTAVTTIGRGAAGFSISQSSLDKEI